MFWILVSIVTIIVSYFGLIRPFYFWRNKGAPQYDISIIWREILLGFIPYRSISETVVKFYSDFPGKRYCGVYQFLLPILLLRDPDLIKEISVKSYDHFMDHYKFLPEDAEPLFERNLFFLKGEKWRDMRSTLSPSFTSSKMKIMFGLMLQCAKQFVDYFQEKDDKVITVEMKDAFTRFTNDVIASSAFGVECNSLKQPNNTFYLMGKEATNFSGLISNLKLVMFFFFPRIAKMFNIKFFKGDVSNFFRKLVKENIDTREKNGIVRPDMIHLLMEARKGKKLGKSDEITDAGFAVVEETLEKNEPQKEKLTDEDITAQALVFFFAGFDSVATLMCFMAHELAVNIEIQQRLQAEVDDTFRSCNGVLTYEALMKMKYMDMVVSETLRKWPNGVVIDRLCIKPYTIEPAQPEEKPIHFKKGDIAWLPIFGLHRDPQYYPEPERFDPERFSDENKANIKPYTYIPFGSGPRSCIGNRFALLETKLIFFYLLSKFEITVVEKTTVPLQIAKSQFQLNAKGGFWLGLKRREI